MSEPAFDIDRLSQDEKLGLIEELWESLTNGEREGLPLTPEHERELDRRLDALEADGSAGITPDELRARIKPTGS